VNIYIAHYHFEEIFSVLGGRSSVNTTCSQCPLETNCDKSWYDSADANCSSYQMVDPLTVNADVCWWRCRLACTIRHCTEIGWCTSCTHWSARLVITVECVQLQTRVCPATAAWPHGVHIQFQHAGQHVVSTQQETLSVSDG